MDIEEWRTVEEFPDYEVSRHGKVRRCKPDWQGKYLGRELKPNNTRGYIVYHLCGGGKTNTRFSHALVCAAFNGPKPEPWMHCAHRDDVKTNNTPENLYWATPAQNMRDAVRNGRVHRGPRSPEALAKLSRGDDHWTRKYPERVAKGDSHWKTGTHGRGAVGERTAAAKLTERQAREIIDAPLGHGTGRKLADKYGVSMGLITAIRKGRAWAYLHRLMPDHAYKRAARHSGD